MKPDEVVDPDPPSALTDKSQGGAYQSVGILNGPGPKTYRVLAGSLEVSEYKVIPAAAGSEKKTRHQQTRQLRLRQYTGYTGAISPAHLVKGWNRSFGLRQQRIGLKNSENSRRRIVQRNLEPGIPPREKSNSVLMETQSPSTWTVLIGSQSEISLLLLAKNQSKIFTVMNVSVVPTHYRSKTSNGLPRTHNRATARITCCLLAMENYFISTVKTTAQTLDLVFD